MPTSTEICNLALGHLGISQTIASLTERSNEAAACNRVYLTARDLVLEDFPWPFAKKQAVLGLIEEFSGATDEWRYSYQYPADAANIIRLLSGTRNDSRQSRTPYKIFYGTSEKEIRTDIEDAIAEYTMRVDETARFPAGFVLALSYKIAELVAPMLSGGDPFKRGDLAAGKYRNELSKAQAMAVNEEQPEQDPESEMIRARDS